MSNLGSAEIIIFNTFICHTNSQNVDVIKKKFNEYFSPQINEMYICIFFTCIQGKQETFFILILLS